MPGSRAVRSEPQRAADSFALVTRAAAGSPAVRLGNPSVPHAAPSPGDRFTPLRCGAGVNPAPRATRLKPPAACRRVTRAAAGLPAVRLGNPSVPHAAPSPGDRFTPLRCGAGVNPAPRATRLKPPAAWRRATRLAVELAALERRLADEQIRVAGELRQAAARPGVARVGQGSAAVGHAE